jgi:hypothetical protein
MEVTLARTRESKSGDEYVHVKRPDFDSKGAWPGRMRKVSIEEK